MEPEVSWETDQGSALRESQDSFALLVNAVADYAVFLLDPQGRVASWNPGAERIKGYSANEIIGRHFSTFYTADAVASGHPQHELELALADGRYEEEGERVRKDGSTFWAHVTITPVYDEAAALRGFAKVTQDVTDRRNREAALAESERRFREVTETMNETFVLRNIDPPATLYVSPSVRKVFGIDREQVYADPLALRRMVHPDDLESVMQQVEGISGMTDLEYRIVRPNGQIRWIRSRIAPVITPDGQLTRIATTHDDVTRDRETTQALAASEERFRALAENSSDMIVRKEYGRISYVSQACRTLLGLEPKALVGTMFVDLIHLDDRDDSNLISPGKGARDQFRSAELRLRRHDGSYVWVDVRSRGVADPVTGEVAESQLSIRDVTERLQLMADLGQARDDAELANRAKSEFLSRMSHELRTPLNAILGFSQLLELDELTAEQRENVEYVAKGGRRLLDLIDEVLDLARIETGQLHVSAEPVSVVEAVDDALALMAPLAAGRQIQMQTNWPAELETQHVMGDRQRLGQVLLNLISNAVKYNVDGGTVTVTCGLEQDDRVLICVADTGPGVAAEHLPLLFAPFERLGAEQSEIEGTGLGLALSKSLVEAMGGRLLVETAAGRGSRFSIELPGVANPVLGHVLAAQASAARPGSDASVHGTVLYIEDNLSNLRLVEAVLAQRPNVELIPAMTAGLGVELARSRRPDLILLDLHLPDESGEAVLRRLRKHPQTAPVPVVIASADASPGNARALKAAGADDYLTKPIDIAALLEIVDRRLAPRAG